MRASRLHRAVFDPGPRSSARLAVARATAAALASLALGASPVPAGVGRWTQMGPDGGAAMSLSTDPAHPGVLYLVGGSGLARDDGLYRSLDGGAHWSFLHRASYPDGLGGPIVLSPHDPRRLYATRGLALVESEDGGRSWRVLLASDVYSFAVDPLTAGTFYALNYDYTLRRSTDGGASWTVLAEWIPQHVPGTSGGGTGHAILVFPTEPRTLLIGYSYGTLRSTDGGLTWSVVGPSNVEVFAVSPTDPDVLLARVTFESCGARSEDGGQSFTRVAEPPGDYCAAFAFDPGNPRRVYAATGIVPSLVVTEDDGATWTPLGGEGLPAQPFVSFLVPDPHDSATLYLGTYEEGLFRSTDGGATWHPRHHGFTGQTIRAVAAAGDPPVVLASGTRFFRTTDLGRTWRTYGRRALVPGRVVPDARLPGRVIPDPHSPGLLYGTGPGVLVSRDLGLTWSPLSTGGLPFTTSLAVDPVRPGVLFAGTWDHGVFKSTDGGRSWAQANTGLVFPEPCEDEYYPYPCPHPEVSALAVSPDDPQVLHLVFDGRVYRSLDGAATWSQASEPPALAARALALDPQEPDRLYAGGCPGVFRSLDGGESWESASGGLPGGEGTPCVNDLLVDPRDSSIVVAATEGAGVFRSLDGGASWAPANEGIAGLHVRDLAWDPATPGRLYAATDGAGVQTLRFVEAQPLPLAGGRLLARAAWRDREGRVGAAQALGVSSAAGVFSFFRSDRPDLALKAVDVGGAATLGLFGAMLSDAEAELTVVDTATGDAANRLLPAGSLATFADLSGFPSPPWETTAPRSPAHPRLAAGDEEDLQLLGRFRLGIDWRHADGEVAHADGIHLSDHAGYFTFAHLELPEVVVKLLDGRAVNGRFWLFVGGLTHLAYTLDVADLETGSITTYDHPAGALRSFADLATLGAP